MTATALESIKSVRSSAEQQLVTAQDLFIRRWGEMGATWGINRTMAEIHALAYIVALPRLNFQEVYGPFALSVSLMFWAFLSGLLLLTGAQLSAQRHLG